MRGRGAVARRRWIAAIGCFCAAGVVAWTASAVAAAAGEKLVDAPIVWYENDRADIAEPSERDPNLARDQFHTTVVRPLRRWTSPSRLVRRVGTLFGGDHVRPAANVNALDEVPNSTWFTNRIGLFPLTPAAAALGNCVSCPDTSGPWRIVSAKSEGVTPGFNIRDASGQTFLIKFDPAGYLGLTTGAGVISARIFWAAGYNVPQDRVVTFRREQLVLAPGVKIREAGVKREMTEADLEAILAKVEPIEPGVYRAIASKFLSGKPVGPFDYRGRRKDDPNDRVKHQDRRELRGLRLFAAWLRHFDTKQHNTLDMYVEEDGRHFVRHYLIDFASTLGAGAHGPTPKHGMEFGVDAPQIFARLFSLGLYEEDWRRLERRGELPEVGYFESDYFDPRGFKPLTPNSAFAHLTDRDGYWAAKIISAFTDEQLLAICEQAHYRDPRATAYVARTLGERRDIIAREWFTRIAPLDFFRCEGSEIVFRDLGVERGLWEKGGSRYRVRVTAVNAEREVVVRGEWRELARLAVDLEAAPVEAPFLALEFQVDRGGSWSEPVIGYVARGSRRVVAVER
jgi:hypothetical protein